MAMLLQLCVWGVILIQLSSSQPTDDIIQENHVTGCGHTDQLLSLLSQIQTAIFLLQSDVAELKTTKEGLAGKYCIHVKRKLAS